MPRPFLQEVGMESIRTVGCLRTLAAWEDFLTTLPQHAEGPEGLGLVWEHEDAPREDGRDPVVKQGWRLVVLRGVELRLPRASGYREVPASESPTGRPYVLVHVDATAVHLHGGLAIERGVVRGDVHVCARVFWPKAADERTEGTVGWRNYLLYLDFHPSASGKTEHELDIYPEGHQRTPLVLLGSVEQIESEGESPRQAIAWATRSFDWCPPRGAKRGGGIDQLLVFLKTSSN